MVEATTAAPFVDPLFIEAYTLALFRVQETGQALLLYRDDNVNGINAWHCTEYDYNQGTELNLNLPAGPRVIIKTNAVIISHSLSHIQPSRYAPVALDIPQLKN